MTEAFFDAVQESYQIYLDKVQGFDPSIPIGSDWPAEGQKVLPDAATFMAEVRNASAQAVLSDLVLDAQDKFDTLELELTQ